MAEDKDFQIRKDVDKLNTLAWDTVDGQSKLLNKDTFYDFKDEVRENYVDNDLLNVRLSEYEKSSDSFSGSYDDLTDKPSYTPTVTSSTTDSYKIGSINISGSDVDIYGKDSDTVYTHPSEKQCDYSYTHPSEKQCDYSYTHPSTQQCTHTHDTWESITLSSQYVTSFKVNTALKLCILKYYRESFTFNNTNAVNIESDPIIPSTYRPSHSVIGSAYNSTFGCQINTNGYIRANPSETGTKPIDAYFIWHYGDAPTPTVSSVSLASDKSILSQYHTESATLTATLNDGITGATITIYKNGVSQGTMTDNNDGTYSYTYTADGSGDLSLKAVCGNVESSTVSVEDCTYYSDREYSMTSSLDISLPSTFKLSFAFKPSDRTTSSGGNTAYVRMGTSSTSGIWVGQGTSSGNHGIMVRPSTNTWCSSLSETTTWNEVECTFDGSTLLYTCNEESVSTSTSISTLSKINGAAPTSKCHLKEIKVKPL